jgi:hypothetical protein
MSEDTTATEAAAPAATAPNNIPVSAMGRFAPGSSGYSALAIGTNHPNWYNLNPSADASFWWLVVVDLTNLNVVANVLGNGYDVPPAVQGYLNNPQYFLFCIGNCLQGFQIPFGAFYTFLQQVGSGPQLARVEQVYHQLKSGIIHNYSYILAATMDTNDYPGFEASSFTGAAVLAMEFMPVTVNGKTTYAPIDPFAS